MNFELVTGNSKLVVGCLLLALSGALYAAGADDVGALLETAAQQRREGNLRLAIESLEKACKRPDAPCDPRLLGELGTAYYQAHRYAQAADALSEAYARAGSSAERALFANDLGNLSASRGLRDEAQRYYEEARAKAAGNASIAVSAGLNLARLAPPKERLGQLQALAVEIAGIADEHERARYSLNLGAQARTLGAPALKLSYEHLDRARTAARQLNDRWLLAETLDALSQLYEDRGRTADALKLADEGIASLQAEQAPDFLINLQWRRARLLRAEGKDALALQAYQAAVEHIESIRQDIPVEYFDGRSSFRETLEPIYLGLADLLLRQADAASVGDNKAQLFRRARDTVELIKQTELQDYLGDRCIVESARPLRSSALLPGTAVLYPVILEKRLELLLETRDGIQSRHVDIDAQALRDQALAFAASIRDAKPDYLVRARALYDVILRPLEATLAREKIDTIVVVPDGALRLIPLGALHDGERFAIAKFAIAIAPGLTMTSAARAEKGTGRVLLAGLSEPGPVMDKLSKLSMELLGRSEVTRSAVTRGVRSADLKEGLMLPGVTEEIAELKRTTRSDRLLNEEFTVSRFREQVSSGSYRIVHIASHAMFSQSAETSFILAYDDVLTIDELQTLLRAEQVQKNPIELLSLSACQTAEGDDRAPLGIAGAALRARAQTALGSLWPVDDQATKTLMVRFYELLNAGDTTKAQALQRAQLELIKNPSFDHPFFWAPFILVGSWL
jgi:CHAT domain-containing protein